MDATTTKTQRVLHLTQPNQGDGYYSGRMTFSDGDPLLRDGVALQMSWELWTELGRPDDITVTIRPDDVLN